MESVDIISEVNNDIVNRLGKHKNILFNII